MISRRSVLLGGSAAALLGAFGDAQSQRALPWVRYNVASAQGKAMLRIYAEGVTAMKALPARDPRSWTFQWYLHFTLQSKQQSLDSIFPDGLGEAFEMASLMWSTCQAHDRQHVDYFLPWHRLYVLQFEAIIRTITGRNEFALPYWDYTSASSYAIPEEFQSRNRTHPIFASLFVRRRNSDGGRLRSANVNGGEPINKYYRGRRNFLVLPNLQQNYSNFSEHLDGQLHNQVHQFVGDESNMGGVPSAAGDPLFWLHHCNIDRIWYAWNAAGGRNPSSTRGVSWGDTSFSFVSAEGDRIDLPIGSISNLETLSYRYDAVPGLAASVSTVASSTTPASRVLLRSGRASQAAVASSADQPAAPIELGWDPVRSILAPLNAQTRLAAVAADITSGAGNLVLRLRDVQAQTDPGTAYQVFLDLPANASDELQDQHYVGLVVFFGIRGGDARGVDDGRDFEFDITDLVKTLGAKSALKGETSITIAPVGAPIASARPVISGGIELQRR